VRDEAAGGGWYRRLMQACGAAAAAVLGIVVLMVCYDVLARNLGAGSLPWIVELTEYALPLATFLAAPWLMYRNEHIRLDLLGAALSPARMAIVDRVAAAFGLAVSVVVAWYGTAAILDSRAAGALVIKSLVFPEWWLFVPVPVCFGLLALECVRRLGHPGAHAEPAVAGLEEERE
jgi:TRAP-type C4-dicarboxylate transport system permease small subunit